MKDHLVLFQGLQQRPGMYVARNEYWLLVSFISGYLMGKGDRSFQDGVTSWLAPMLAGEGRNLHWPMMIEYLYGSLGLSMVTKEKFLTDLLLIWISTDASDKARDEYFSSLR